MKRPLAIDLFCGLGGWTEALLAEGYDVVGFDVERHRYPARAPLPENGGTKARTSGVDFGESSIGKDSRHRSFNYANECAVREMPLTGGWIEYPAQLVLQDVLTLHGAQFRNATLIVASPPCQAYSYRAMPWKRAKALPPPDNSLFEACFRIQREASAAAGRHVPLVVENVRGAQKWVGRARWNFGSFYLWGDVPALMPFTYRASKVPGFRFDGNGGSFQSASVEGVKQRGSGAAWFDKALDERRKEATHIKNTGGSWFAIAPDTTSGKGRNPDGRKVPGGGAEGWFGGNDHALRQRHSAHPARKFASAMIAKIPAPLARHIARVYLP
jgi:hypothetical protein